MLEAVQKSAVISKPGDRPFDFISFSISSKLSAIFKGSILRGRSVGNDKIDATGSKSPPVRIAVISSVRYHSLRFVFWPPRPFLGDSDIGESGFEKFDFSPRCRLKVQSDWNSLSIRRNHPFGSFAFFGRSDAKPPFLAGEKLPSTKNSFQSRRCFSSRDPRNVCQMFSQIPCSSHVTRRRQQVVELGYPCGRSTQGAPVLRTHNMPSKTSRLLQRGRPPRFPGFSGGNNGVIFSHNSSDMNGFRLAMAAPPLARKPQTLKKYNAHAVPRVLK